MEKRIVALVVILVAIFSVTALSNSTPRSLSLGGAYVADPQSAGFMNPAALSESVFSVSATTGATFAEIHRLSTLLQGLDVDKHIDDLHGMAFASGALSLGNIGVRASVGCDVDFDFPHEYEGVGSADGNSELTIAWGKKLTDPILELGKVSVGVEGTYRKITKTDHTVSGSPTLYQTVEHKIIESSYSLGFGIRAQLSDMISFGIATKDVIGWSQTSSYTITKNYDTDGLIQEAKNADSTDRKLSRQLKWTAGVALRPPALGLLAIADMESDGTLRLGVEKSFLLNGLAIRIGRVSPANGNSNWTAGAGFNLGPANLNISQTFGDSKELVASIAMNF